MYHGNSRLKDDYICINCCIYRQPSVEKTNKKYKLINEVKDSLALAEDGLKLNWIYDKTETKRHYSCILYFKTYSRQEIQQFTGQKIEFLATNISC